MVRQKHPLTAVLHLAHILLFKFQTTCGVFKIILPQNVIQLIQIEVKNSSSTVVTPNFDFMETLTEQEHEQIFKDENVIDQEQSLEKKRKWSLKSIIFAILFAIFGIWGIVNISTIDSLNSQIEVASETYNVNLVNYLKNLTALDTTNQENMENLFEVIPTDTLPPTYIAQSSNWFDRFCNFLAGLFGG